MKLCFIADPNHVNTINWVEFFAGPLGHDVHLLCLNKVIHPLKNVTIHKIRVPFKNTKMRYICGISKVKEAVKKINPDLLIGYRVTSYGFMAAATGFHPLVLAAQGQNIVYPSNSKLLQLIARFALKRADLINAWAPHMKEKMIRLGANPCKIFTLPRGVDTKIFKPLDKTSILKVFRIISTRSLRLEPTYNIEPIIYAVKILEHLLPEIEYFVVGNGPRNQYLKNLVFQLGLEKKIVFLGAVAHNELPRLLCQCPVYISNVWSDGVSSSLLEAMACGLFPIIVDNISNRSWIMNGINGFLVPPENPQSMAKAIKRSFENVNLRNSVNEINRKIILERGSWDVNMKKIESAYIKLVKLTKRRSSFFSNYSKGCF